MAYDMTDDLARRLRASRPSTARPDEDAFDAGLLARVREQPIAAPSPCRWPPASPSPRPPS
jgi:hypothetical protein